MQDKPNPINKYKTLGKITKNNIKKKETPLKIKFNIISFL